MVQNSWFERIPKVELHIHLEGSIPHSALWELVRKYGGDPLIPTLESLIKRFEYRDFPHFIEMWVWKNRFLREYEDFTFIARSFAENILSQDIRYAEVFYSPPDFIRHGLEPQKLTEAIRQGFDAVPRANIALVADVVRDFGAKQAERTLAQINEVKEFGVIGVGIGGSEHAFPPELFTEIFEQARKLGFHTNAHAGEAAGAESVRGAVMNLRAERVGHGTRAIEDPKLMDYLAEYQIPIEMCPVSNVCTGVVASLAEHPIRRFFDKGIPVSVNTDDPAMFGNRLADEYRRLCEECGFSRTEIRQLVRNAVETSWLDQAQKHALLAEIMSDSVWNE